MNIIQQIQNLIGQIPAGYEIIEYMCGFVLLVFLCSWGYSLIAGIINSVTGRR